MELFLPSVVYSKKLPGEVGEGFIGFRHFDRLFALGHGVAFTTEGGKKFIGKPQEHRFAFLATRSTDDPADGQALLPAFLHWHGNLVSRTADALGTDFHGRLDIL